MTARDDYPHLARYRQGIVKYSDDEARAVPKEIDDALDEIDRLRAALAALYLELGVTDEGDDK